MPTSANQQNKPSETDGAPVAQSNPRAYWMAVGTVNNWNEAFRLGNTWGLEPKRQKLWEAVQPNDVFLFYAMRPVAGVIGYGTIKTKFRQTQPLWPQEIAQGSVIWPLRFEIAVSYCVPPDKWEKDRITSEALRFKAGLSFRNLDPQFALEVISKFKEGQTNDADEIPMHRQLKQQLVEVGRLTDERSSESR